MALPFTPPEEDVLGTQQLLRLKQRLQGQQGYAGITADLGNMMASYGLPNLRPGGANRAGLETVGAYLSGLQWQSQDFTTKQKEFKIGGIILDDRIRETQARMASLQEGVSKGDPNFAEYVQDRGKYEQTLARMQERLGLMEKQREASYGFSGLMDLSAQVYEGKQGAFSNLLAGLSKAVALKQSVGGTYMSAAGAAQAASADVALSTRVKGDLVPLLGEAGASANEFGYNFNLAGLPKDVSQSWEKYFDARIKAQESGKAFDEEAWAKANASDALRTIIEPPKPQQFDIKTQQLWQGAPTSRTAPIKADIQDVGQQTYDPTLAPSEQPQQRGSTETLTLQGLMVDRLDAQGRPILKGTSGPNVNPTALEQQRFLNRPDVTYAWKGAPSNRVLVATRSFENTTLGADNPWNVKDKRLLENENYQQALVNFALASRETGKAINGFGVKGQPFGFFDTSLGATAKAQEAALNAAERHKFDTLNATSAQAEKDLAAAKAAGYNPTSGMTIEQFQKQQEAAKVTIARR